MSREDVATFEPKRRGLWFKLLVGFCALVLILAGWLFLERVRGQIALRKYEKALIAKGEKLTFAEVIPPLPDGPNKAIELVGLCSSFQTGAVMLVHAPPSMKCIAPGKALIITKEAEWGFEKLGRKEGKFTWRQVGEDLGRNQSVLNDLRATVRSPVLRYPLDYRGINTVLSHLAPQRGAAQWLSGSALYKVQTANINGAIDDIESIVMLARLTEQEPMLISQLVRIAVLQMAVNDCWPLLQHDASDTELMRLAKVFSEIDTINPMVRGLQGERAWARDGVGMIRSAQIDFEDFGLGGRFGDDDEAPSALDKVPYGDEMKGALRAHVIYPTWRYVFSYEDELHVIEEMQSLIDATVTAKSDKSAAALRAYEAKAKEKGKPGGEFNSWRYFMTGSLVPGIEKAGSRAFRAQTHCEIVVAAAALKRYHMRHKRYPGKLEELVPEFVSEVPIDYQDGKPLRYRLEGDQFILWSIGPDGKDDGGTPKSEPTFSWMLGPDDVWPQPASEAEAVAYWESQRKP